MKKVFLIYMLAAGLCAAGLFVSSAAAQAAKGKVYFAGYLGLNLSQDHDFVDSGLGDDGDIELDSSASFAGALGLRLNKQLRLEAELSYSNPDIGDLNLKTGGAFASSGNLSSYIGMVNLYYDVPVQWQVKPFLSAGMGYGVFDADFNDAGSGVNNFSESDGAFTWQLGAGFQYETSENLSFTAGYQYLNAGTLEFNDVDIDYDNHVLRVGLRYELPYK